MMTCFYDSGSVMQILLLVISQFAVISLVGSIVLLLRYRGITNKLVGTALLLLLNTLLYVLMQLDSRITGLEEGLHLHIPYVVLLTVTLLSLAYGIRVALRETRNRKTIHPGSIKEAFDNLPTGICYFNEAGLPVLCNLAMHRFSFAVCGRDIQFITDLEECLAEEFVPMEGTIKEGKVFLLPDGRVLRLMKSVITQENGDIYTQYTAPDITDLYRTRGELLAENRELRRVQEGLKQLSANVVAATREVEILNTKMRVHDEMGRCLVEARKYLREDSLASVPTEVVRSWQKAVSMLKYNNDAPQEDMLSQVLKTCEALNVTFIKTGSLPKDESKAYLLICALRECLTNGVRYGGATELYAEFSETSSMTSVSITNNGKQPTHTITEGGGLSTLRRRVEREGGAMIVDSLPRFRLTVSLPKRKEDIL